MIDFVNIHKEDAHKIESVLQKLLSWKYFTHEAFVQPISNESQETMEAAQNMIEILRGAREEGIPAPSKVWVIITSLSGIPEVSLYGSEEECRKKWDDQINDILSSKKEPLVDSAFGDYTIEIYDKETKTYIRKTITSEIAWNVAWCEMHKVEMRWYCEVLNERGMFE